MVHRLTSLETSGVPAPQRPVFWAAALSRLCGRLHTDGFGADSIDGRIAYGSVGPLKLCQIDATRHRVALSAAWAGSGQHPLMKVVPQLKGTSVFEQDGRSITITPGGGIAYDVARPHVISSQAKTKHLVVIVPRTLAALRGFMDDGMRPQIFPARAGVGRLASDLVKSTFKEIDTITADCEEELDESILDIIGLPLLLQRGLQSPARRGDLLKTPTKHYIRRNLHDPELSIEHIAAALGCSKRYLHMAFADEGVTIAKYIWMTRLEQCRAQLANLSPEGATVTDVAFALGLQQLFPLQPHLQRDVGVPPSHLLRQKPR